MEINQILDLKEVRYLKSLAVQKQMYELAACVRDHEKYLMTPEGELWNETVLTTQEFCSRLTILRDYGKIER